MEYKDELESVNANKDENDIKGRSNCGRYLLILPGNCICLICFILSIGTLIGFLVIIVYTYVPISKPSNIKNPSCLVEATRTNLLNLRFECIDRENYIQCFENAPWCISKNDTFCNYNQKNICIETDIIYFSYLVGISFLYLIISTIAFFSCLGGLLICLYGCCGNLGIVIFKFIIELLTMFGENN
jgi:hypothetical protein